MSAKQAKPRAAVKSNHFRPRNHVVGARNQNPKISLVMQKVKVSLGAPNAAETLQDWAKIPLSTSQKLLSGDAVENGKQLRAMAAHEQLVISVLLGLIEPGRGPIVRQIRNYLLNLEVDIDAERKRRAIRERE